MVTKRQLGLFIGAAGLLLILGIVAVDIVGAGRWVGLGPLQRIGIEMAVALVAVGLLLTRLGDRPA